MLAHTVRTVRKKMKQLLTERKGQSMIMMAVSIPVLLGMSLAYIEFNEVRYVKSVVQNALDAGALAGAATQVSVIVAYNTGPPVTGPCPPGSPPGAVSCSVPTLTPIYDQQIWVGQPGASSSMPHGDVQARDAFFNFLDNSSILKNTDISTSTMNVSYNVIPSTGTAPNGTSYTTYKSIDGSVSFPINVPILQAAMRVMGGGHSNSQITINLTTTAQLQTTP